MALDTGKTHSRHMRLYIDGIDLSGDMRSVGNFGMTYDEIDMHAWPDGIVYYQLGAMRQFLDGFQAIFATDGTDMSHDELKGLESYVIMVPIGIKGAPADPTDGDVGDPCFCAVLDQSSVELDASGPLFIRASFNGPPPTPKAAALIGTTCQFPHGVWGVLIKAKEQVAATKTENYVDDSGAAGAAYGGVGYLQIFEAETVGTWAFVIEDSPDHSSWATWVTFSADGTAVGGEAEAPALNTQTDRYIRAKATYSGGGSTNMTFAMAFVRYRELKHD